MHNSFGWQIGRTLLAIAIVAGLAWAIGAGVESDSEGYMDAEDIRVGDTLFFYRSCEIRNPFEGDTIRIDRISKGWVLHHKLHVDDKPRTMTIDELDDYVDRLDGK
jgi:hypothetical protein